VILDRNRGGSFLASLLVGSALLGTFLFLTYFLQETLGYSALKTGFAFLPFSGGIILGAGLASRLLPRTGPRALMVGGMLMATGGLFWFTGLSVAAATLPTSFLPRCSSASAWGSPSSPCPRRPSSASTRATPGRERPRQRHPAGGRSLGTALLNTVAASAAATYLTAHVHAKLAVQRAAVHGYTTAFTVSAFLLAAAAVVAFALIRASRDQVQPEAALGDPALLRPAVAESVAF